MVSRTGSHVDNVKPEFISESVENVLILILNLYQSVIPTSMVADFFKQLLIEKWKHNEGPKVRYGCTVPGPADPHKQDIVASTIFQYSAVKLCQRAKSVQNIDAEFEVLHTHAKILKRPLESQQYAYRILIDIPPSHLFNVL